MDVYKIGVSIALANGMSPVLAIIGRDLLGIKTKIGDVEGGMTRWKTAAIGVAAIMGAGGILGAYTAIVNKGAELAHQQEAMRVAGFTERENAKATAESWRLAAQYKNVGVTDVAKIIGETRLPYGSAATAVQMAEPGVQFTSIMKSLLGKDKGGDAAEQMFELVRAGEMRNISLNPAKMRKFYDDAAKITEAFDGKIDPQDLFQFLKYARTNTPYLSERFVTSIAPSLMLEMGSSSAGTALTSLGQSIIAGKMTKRAAQEMERLGLIDPSNILKTMSTSTQLKPGAVKGWRQAASDPDLWAQQVLLPAMVAKGITDPLAQRLEFGVVFGNRTAENVANVLATQSTRLNKDAAMIGGASGLGGAKELAAKDPVTAMQSFSTAWNNLLTALGRPQVDTAVGFLNRVSGAIDAVAGLAARHPTAVKVIGGIALALAAALAVGGVVALGAAAIGAILASGPVAGIAVAIAAIATYVGTIIALNWPTVVKVFDTITGALGKFFSWVINNPVTKALMLGARFAIDPLGAAASLVPSQTRPPAVPGHSGVSLTIHNTTQIGTKKIHQEIIHAVAGALNAPQTGARNSDPRITPAMPGATLMGAH